nr:immunoglobulin heavy chain junction region [Mus musculus]MBK4198242.1 immunoglobulin heavy chain junction region [Mus musculus]
CARAGLERAFYYAMDYW